MAARPTWKGYLKISLVNIPIKVFPATDAGATLSFNQLHGECQTRIQQKRWCPKCEREVPNTDIVKGFEFEKGRYVIVDEEDIEKVRVDSTRVINLEKFTDDTAIDPIYLERPYYLAPDGPVARDAFAVIREGMKGKAGIGKVALYGREYLVKVQPREQGLIMYTLRHANEIRSMDAIDELTDMPEKVKPEEVKLAKQVMGTFEGEVDLQEYRDDYQVGLREIIDAKIEGREIVAQEVEAPPKVVNLMDALRKSLDTISSQEESRGAGGADGGPTRSARGQGVRDRGLGIGHDEKTLADHAVGRSPRSSSPSPRPAQTRGVTAEDYFAFETLGDPRFSPDGSTIAFVVTTVDQKQNRRRSAIWSVPADGSREPSALTTRAAVVEQPAMEPGRQGDRLSVGAAGAGRRRDRYAAHAGVAAAARRRRGAARHEPAERRLQLPVVARRRPSSSSSAAAGRAIPRSRRATCGTTSTPTTSSTTAAGSTTSARISGSWTSRRAASTQLTSGDDWNDSDPQWSPDGRQIAFVSDRTGKAFDESQNTDVWVDRRERRPADEDFRSHERRQLAALVARRPDDRVRQLGAGEVAPEDLAGAERRRRSVAAGGRRPRPDSRRRCAGPRTAARSTSRPA